MSNELQGKRIAFLATDGVEQVELTEPWKALKDAGAEVELLSLEAGEIQGVNHMDKGDTFPVDKAVSEADATDYDGLVLPGGVANPDFLRADEDAVSLRPRLLRAGQAGRRDLPRPLDARRGGRRQGPHAHVLAVAPDGHPERRAANWVDEEVVVDGGLVTSRKPDDLPAFNAKLVEEFAEGVHEEQRESVRPRRPGRV